MPLILHKAAELCFQLDHAQSIEQLRAAFQRAASVFGTSFFFVVFRSGKSISPPVQLVITDYPRRFQQYFDEQRAIEFDPIVMHALTTIGAFRWDGKYRTDRELALQRECIACGMEFGFSCSDRGPEGSQLLLCFCGSKPIAPEADDWDRTASASVMLASVAHRTFIRIARRSAAPPLPGKSRLTVAELQALQMTAAAMTAKEVAAVLGVQPVTVRYYLARAAEKLGVASGREAVARALEDGLVDTRIFPRVGFAESSSDIDD
ncbi:MAG TPA: LuxR family transcriptional regulator [Solimonas sp.]|nr:LuxR family transcriptional regulator [Solimonas sp.]